MLERDKHKKSVSPTKPLLVMIVIVLLLTAAVPGIFNRKNLT